MNRRLNSESIDRTFIGNYAGKNEGKTIWGILTIIHDGKLNILANISKVLD